MRSRNEKKINSVLFARQNRGQTDFWPKSFFVVIPPFSNRATD